MVQIYRTNKLYNHDFVKSKTNNVEVENYYVFLGFILFKLTTI